MSPEAGVAEEGSGGARRRLWPALLLGGMAIVFFARFLSPNVVFLMRDLFLKHYPLHIYARQMLRQGALPLWNPYTGCGEPFLANIEAAVWYPPNLLYLFLPVQTATAALVVFHTWLTCAAGYALCRVWRISHLGSLLAATALGFNTYWLTRIEFFPAHASIAWFPVVLLLYVLWARSRRPLWILLGGLAFGMQLLAGWPEGALYPMAAVGLYAALVAVWDARQRRSWRAFAAPFAALAALTAIGVLVAAAQLLPTMQATLHSAFQSAGMNPDAGDASVNPLMLATLLLPFLYGTPGYIGRYWAPSCFEYWCGSFYVGVVPVVLIVAALLMRLALFRAPAESAAEKWQRRPAAAPPFRAPAARPATAVPQSGTADGWLGARLPFLILLLAISTLYAMGVYTPVFGLLWQAIPLLHKFRWPSKSLVCTVFALSCLSGLALDYLARSVERAERANRRVERLLVRSWTFALFAVAGCSVAGCLLNGGTAGKVLIEKLLIFPAFPAQMPKELAQAFLRRAPWGIMGRSAAQFAALGIVTPALVLLWSSRRRARAAAGWLLLLLAYADLFLTGLPLLPSGSADLLAARPLIPKQREAAFERALKFTDTTPPRMSDQGQYVYGERDQAVFRWARDGELMSWPIADHVFVANTTGNFQLPGIVMLREELAGSQASPEGKRRILHAMSVQYLLPLPSLLSFYLGAELGKVRAQDAPGAMPRAYVVGGPVPVADGRAACEALAAGAFDLCETAAVERSGPGAEELAALAPGRVAYEVSKLEDGADGNSLRIEVRSERAALLVVTDSWYPGWRATVNGRETPIARVNGAFRGVRIPTGKSVILMRFRPWTVPVGIFVSLGTLAAVIFWFIFLVRQRART